MSTVSTPVWQLKKGGHVLIQGHPVKIVDVTTSKMMSSTSGRERHPDIVCDGCKKDIEATQVRYACLNCRDFDLCDTCEDVDQVRQSHFDDKHVFAKIRDSTVVTVKKYRVHNV